MDEAQLVSGEGPGGEDIEPAVGKAPGHGWRLSVSDFTVCRLTRYVVCGMYTRGRRGGKNSCSVPVEILLIAEVPAIAQYTEVQPEAIEIFTLSAISPIGHEFSMERTFVDVLGVLGAEG